MITCIIQLDHEGSKKQKTNEASRSVQEQPEEEEIELPQEDLQQMMMVIPVEEVFVEALHVKYPIIDWEVNLKTQESIGKLSELETIQKLIRLLMIYPTDDKERTLWVELKRLFEPDIDDILGHDIFMLVEKDYPQTRGLLTLMLCNKLQVDQYSEMANELLKKIDC
ncbi:hypothetical protein Tco_0496623 [Tanacetum coccineum]